ncbi:MAG: T9SS type A sorting domain-containing protein, partial [Phycisphaeraceae bacterium]|nr:T9SS type A sorting domain-containing protein [Phycisphaeraceae bacterium]
VPIKDPVFPLASIIPQTGVVCSTAIYNSCCPINDLSLGRHSPKGINNIPLQEAEDMLNFLYAEYDSVFGILDNGNTTQLLSALDTDTSDTYIQDLLIANSPLSDQVIAALIDWADEISAGAFSEIIIPNSPIADELRPALEEKLTLEIPTNIADAIRAAQDSDTHRTLTAITREVEAWETERQDIMARILVAYADTGDIDSLIITLEAENNVDSDRALLGLYISLDSLDAAEAKIAEMSPANAEEEAYIAIQNLLLELKLDSLDVFGMDSIQEALVREVAAMDSGLAAVNACAILHLVFNEACPLPEDGFDARMQNSGSPAKPMAMLKQDSSYLGENVPNPFSNNTVIPYTLPEGVNTAYINIYSITGKRISSHEVNNKNNKIIISSDNLENAVYIYKLESNGQVLGNKKMIIIK